MSTNVEKALGLEPSPDFVVWEGNPLQFGGTPVLSFRRVRGSGRGAVGGGPGAGGVVGSDLFEVASCWPAEDDV